MNEEDSVRLLEENILQKLTTSNIEEIIRNACDEQGRTLLHIASQAGMEKIVKFLIQNGARIDQKDNFGRTPLMLACFAGNINLVELLLSQNADINCIDKYGFNLLTMAAYGGCNIVKYIYNKNNSSEYMNNYLGQMSLLTIASSIGNEELVNFIISKEPQQINNKIEKSGMTPLMLSICGGYIKISKQLLDYGADIRMTSKASLSPICYAFKLSFPLLQLSIPQITLNDEGNQVNNDSRLPKHPLTPNLYLSPMKNLSSPKKCLHWFKNTIKRSKSMDNRKKCFKKKFCDKDDTRILKSIFQIAKLQQYWPIFKEQQINFRTFLTMDEEDLCNIGIKKLSGRKQLLTLIEHYNHIFYL